MSKSKGASSRLSEASQFFNLQDAEMEGVDSDSTTDRVVELLNQAQLSHSDNKITNLKQVQELIINKDPTLLDNFLDEILVFQQDKSSDVRKFVIGFIEEACKKDPVLLTKTISTLVYMLGDDNVNVMKRVVLACASLYRVALQLVCKSRTIKEDTKNMWEAMCELKSLLCGLIESDNDGIRTHAIKFMEMLILVHSSKSQDSDAPKREGDVSLDIVPRNHPFVKMTELREEGGTTLEALLSLCASPTISSVNLMAVLASLTNIAKQRPAFMPMVVQAFESLHANLPPTLAKSQVSSVRKNLKMQLFTLLKQPAAIDFVAQIGTLLTDLGATQSELQKSLPKINPDSVKKARSAPPSDPEHLVAKKSKLESSTDTTASVVFNLAKATDITTQDLIPKLTKEAVTDLVLVSMLLLPKSMPPHFQETFTPIAAAGGQAQVTHLARLMAAQMTNANIGSGIDQVKKEAEEDVKSKKEAEERAKLEPQSIPVIGGMTTSVVDADQGAHKHSILDGGREPRSLHEIATELGRQGKQLNYQPHDVPQLRMRKIKPFKLHDVARSMTIDDRNRQILLAFTRILTAEKKAIQAGASVERSKLLIGLVSQFPGDLTKALMNFILGDFRNRYDVAVTWLYHEYLKEESKTPGRTTLRDSKYNACFVDILLGLQATLDPRDKLFSRFILEAPTLSHSIYDIVKRYCEDNDRYLVGFATLREIIAKSGSKATSWLQLLLELTTREKEHVRVQAIHSAKKLHSKPGLADMIEKFALHSLQQLARDHPPMKETEGGTIAIAPGDWSDDAIKSCLYLYLALLPTNHALFHDLAEVYTEASPLIKRTILRHLEHPVRAVGMKSPELLKLVEKCPAGAETLVTRILHIVTDKNSPTPELVRRVKELYNKRVSDVRFLIPVLNGLEKQEVIAVLPKLVTQSPNVVKEVFNRLLGSFQAEDESPTAGPLSPAELLVALHNIDSKSDVKAVMKAISLCLSEKSIYTQEVLASVLQQLLEQSPLPTLFMRTVILTLGMCRKLVGFVMNLLAKLINKQVWKQPKVWQGFVKCCQMTKPQSFPVILQLPPRQLENVFEMSPELKDTLITHVQNFAPNQRAHIPKSVLQVLERETKKDTEVKQETDSESTSKKPLKVDKGSRKSGSSQAANADSDNGFESSDDEQDIESVLAIVRQESRE